MREGEGRKNKVRIVAGRGDAVSYTMNEWNHISAGNGSAPIIDKNTLYVISGTVHDIQSTLALTRGTLSLSPDDA